jgi:hypothetical protein
LQREKLTEGATVGALFLFQCDTKMDRILEVLSGIGRVHANGEVVLDDVGYDVTVSQHMVTTRTLSGDSEVPGLESIEGRISSPIAFTLLGEPIELEFQDGRRWACYIQSGSGNLVNRGGIK